MNISDISWSSATFTPEFAIVSDCSPMPTRLRHMKGRRGRKMRAAWKRGRSIGLVKFNGGDSGPKTFNARWESDGVLRLF